jgi:hypothetical protein
MPGRPSARVRESRTFCPIAAVLCASKEGLLGTLLELPREIATALFFAAAIGIGTGALVAGRTHRLLPAVHVALGAFAVAAVSFGYAIWRNHRWRSRRMFGRIRPRA